MYMPMGVPNDHDYSIRLYLVRIHFILKIYTLIHFCNSIAHARQNDAAWMLLDEKDKSR